MARQDHPIDDLFRDKLSGHQEKPSTHVWEKLGARLHQANEKKGFPWLRVAASLLVVATLAYVVWSNIQKEDELKPLVTESNTIEEALYGEEKGPAPLMHQDSVGHKEDRDMEGNSSQVEEDENEQAPVQEVPAPRPLPSKPTPSKVGEQPNGTLAVREEEKALEPVSELDLVAIDSLGQVDPKPDIEQWVAENLPNEKEEEVAYRVHIISSGISEKPKKEPLAKEIEQTIYKIGGLLGKVDQGFADLQDAKNNLFATLISKSDDPE